jgi:predicted amidophosphoribosyltransferase
LQIALAVWVVRDAKGRGVSSPIGWLILVMLTGLLGLIIYFFSRPGGEVGECPNCHNKRLIAMAQCPHCGASTVSKGVSSGSDGKSNGSLFCTECGSRNQAGSKFCEKCGTKID